MSEINKKSDFGWGTDAYPAQEPQEKQFQAERAEMSEMVPEKDRNYSWIVAGKDILVVSDERLNDAFTALGVKKDHHGPIAIGRVTVSNRWVTSFVVEESNIDLDYLDKIFQRWAKDPQIDFEDLNHNLYIDSVKNKNGIPLPIKTNYTKRKLAADPGFGMISPIRDMFKYPWKNTDESLYTDIQIQDNDRGKLPGQGDVDHPLGEGLTEETYQCPECLGVFKNGIELREHMVNFHRKEPPTGPEYEIRDNDEFFYPDNEASRPGGTVSEPGIHTGAASPPEISGPIPFSFDPEKSRIYVGEPGDERVKLDSINMFGLAEGYYTPDGDIIIVTQSYVPYSIKYFLRLWYEIHPELKVKKAYLLRKEDGRKIKERVANA